MNILKIIIGLLFVFISKILFKQINKKKTHKFVPNLAAGILFLSTGIVIIVSCFIKNEFFGSLFFSLAFSIFCFIHFSYWMYYKFTCNTPVSAEFINKSSFSIRQFDRYYYLTFKYSHNGKKYKRKSIEYISEFKLKRKFELNNIYTIYINKNKPHKNIINRRISFEDIAMLTGFLLSMYGFISNLYLLF